ncbi:hypothetical protein AB3S75_020700 [Citrus x aurantiifolia]
MQESGMEPDAITVLAILSACNHAGLVKEAETLFNNVMKEKRIALAIEHYACYVDLLGKSACRIHGRLEVAEMLAHRLIEAEPENAANYTLLSMVCSDSGNWLGAEEVWRVMRAKGLSKSYGFSRIENEY